jgi:hypothetical protein
MLQRMFLRSLGWPIRLGFNRYDLSLLDPSLLGPLPILGPHLDVCHPLFTALLEFLPKRTKGILFPKTNKSSQKEILKEDRSLTRVFKCNNDAPEKT